MDLKNKRILITGGSLGIGKAAAAAGAGRQSPFYLDVVKPEILAVTVGCGLSEPNLCLAADGTQQGNQVPIPDASR